MDTLRVVTANLHACAGIPHVPGGGLPASVVRATLARAAAAIAAAAPDVVCAQEVDLCSARTGHVRQADELAALLGMRVVTAVTYDTRGHDAPIPELRDCLYGLALFAREPVLDVRELLLGPAPPAGPHPPELRKALSALVPIGGPIGSVRVACAHLEPRPPVVRRHQLLSLSAAWPGPLIVGADLNEPRAVAPASIPEGPRTRYGWLGAAPWGPFPAAPGAGPTWPYPDAVADIDHILARGPGLRVTRAWLVDHGGASDHWFLAADIALQEPAQG